jgi:hypothetical protein
MITLEVHPRVLKALKDQFPSPKNSATKALKKYVSLLEQQLNSCETRGRGKDQITRDIYYISLSKQRHKGGQIGPEKIRLQNWLEANQLELFKVILIGSNLTEQLTQIKLTKWAKATYHEQPEISPLVQTDDEIAQVIRDQEQTNQTFFDKLYPEYTQLSQDERSQRYDLVPVDLKSLKNYQRWLEETASLISVEDRLKYLNQIDQIARVAKHTEGFYLQKKKPSQFGRVYYEGLSVQNMSKQLREAMLGRCYEYDLKSAVFSWKMLYAHDAVFIEGLGRTVDQAFKTTIGYLRDKQDFISSVRYMTFTADSNAPKELQVKLIKQAMTAISFGARLCSTGWKLSNGKWQNTSIGDIFKNPNERDRFIDCCLIKDFVREQQMLDKVIFNSDFKDQKDAFGGADVYTASGRLSRAKVIAFMYQTYETDLMDIVELLVNKLGKQVIARVHDAIYTKQKLTVDDRDEIEHYLRSNTHNRYWSFNHKEIEPFNYNSEEPRPFEPVNRDSLFGWFGRMIGAQG